MRTRSFRAGIAGLFAMAGLLIALPPLAVGQLTSDRALWVHRADFPGGGSGSVVLSALQVNWRANQEPIMGVNPLEVPTTSFDVFLDRQKLKVTGVRRFADSPEGIDVVLAVDISGPAYAQFSRVKEAVRSFVRRLRPGKDRVALLTFGTDTKISQFPTGTGFSPFTSDVSALETELVTPPERERQARTVLYKALTEAIGLAAAGHSGASKALERVVVALSDGHDEGQGYDISNVIATAKGAQVPVFGLGLPEPSTKNQYHDVLDRIARESGAVFVPVRDAERLTEVYEKLDTLLKAQFVVGVQVPAELQDGGNHALQVLAVHERAPLSARFEARTQVAGALRPIDDKGTTPPIPRDEGKRLPWWVRFRPWLWGGGALVALLAGLVGLRLWRLRDRGKHEQDDDGSGTTII